MTWSKMEAKFLTISFPVKIGERRVKGLECHFQLHRVSKKTSTHIIGYKLRNSCPILIIFDSKIPHII